MFTIFSKQNVYFVAKQDKILKHINCNYSLFGLRMHRSKNSLFGLRRSLFSYHNSQSTSMSSSLSAISKRSGATSSTSDSVTSANCHGSVAREAVRACGMDVRRCCPWGWALIRGWALFNFFYLQGGRLFEVGLLVLFFGVP